MQKKVTVDGMTGWGKAVWWVSIAGELESVPYDRDP